LPGQLRGPFKLSRDCDHRRPAIQYFEKLVRWFDQERELLRSQGIDGPDPRVFMDAVMRRHLSEVKSDPALVVAILTQEKKL
jgi:hypothetical protein